MMTSLRNVFPWLRFMGIVAYISAALMILAGLVLTAVPLFMEGKSLFLGIGLMVMGLISLLFPARFLYGSGARLRGFFQNYAGAELEHALRDAAFFWKFCGGLTAAGLALIPIAIVIGIYLVINGYY
ncbi:MAG: hypothetical protein LBG76_10115 [Treponema sp.]|nr:hypothetical protein [Treponema sp.]